MNKTHLKRLKRKKKLQGKAIQKRSMENFVKKHGGREGAMQWILDMAKVKKAKKKPVKKEKKPLKPYRAVKLTTKLDKVLLEIKNAAPNDSRIESLKRKRDELKAKLNLK